MWLFGCRTPVPSCQNPAISKGSAEPSPLPPARGGSWPGTLQLNIHFGQISPNRSWKQCHRPQPPLKKNRKKGPKIYFYISPCFLKEKKLIL